jgi:hypothetical protein
MVSYSDLTFSVSMIPISVTLSLSGTIHVNRVSLKCDGVISTSLEMMLPQVANPRDSANSLF